MPTPSAPDPQPQYAFTSSCPEPDERHDDDTSMMSNPADAAAAAAASQPAHDDFANSPIAIPPHFIPSDGLVPDTNATSSPLSDDATPTPTTQGAVSFDDQNNKPADDVVPERPHSPPYSFCPPPKPPRQGVGTSSSSWVSSVAHDPGSENATEEDYELPSLGIGVSSKRVIPNSSSSMLRAGSRFTGTQQSERQVYEVQVDIKYVDLSESFLCGYLRIQGLTDDHPTLTTFFEGEIITGHKYDFTTRHPDWGATLTTDLSHWGKFPAFRPYSKSVRRAAGSPQVFLNDVAQNKYVFMRWKEHFLVPDHRVRSITGASFEGFYYICFNQIEGRISGIYFHSKSERFQQLELIHVEDRGCFSAMEFR